MTIEMQLLEEKRKHLQSDHYERNRMTFYRRKLFTNPLGEVLDIGSNSGEILRQFSNMVTKITVLDYDLALSNAAKINLGDKCTVSICANAVCLPFRDQAFDTVMMLELIEHIPWKYHRECLGEAWRVLKPGGVFILSTPNESSITSRTGKWQARKTGKSWEAWDSTHVALYRAPNFLKAAWALEPASLKRCAYYYLPNQVSRSDWSIKTRLLHKFSSWISLNTSGWQPMFGLGFHVLEVILKPSSAR